MPRYEIPVHRTFIDYACPAEIESATGFRTAPASMANCMRDSLAAGEAVVWRSRSEEDLTPSSRQSMVTVTATPSARTPTSPSAAYSMSPRSAKATGQWLESHEGPSKPAWPLARPERISWAKEMDSDDSASSTRSSEDGDASDDEDLGLCPAYSEGAALPSVGSAGHGTGHCRRCCFFPKGRCMNGFDCNFCHFQHEKRKPKSKKKRHKRKKGRKARGASAAGPGDGAEAWNQQAIGPTVCLQDVGGGYLTSEQLQELGLPAGCFVTAMPAQAVMVQVPFCAY
jgi:hypothetical protein